MRINQKKFEAYQKQHGREIICLPGQTVNVTLAAYLIANRTSETTPEIIDVEAWASLCGFDHRPVREERDCRDVLSLIFARPDGRYVSIEHAHTLKDLDLQKPLMCLSDGTMADGHHRLYRAFMLGVETLPLYRLTREEERACISKHDR